MSAPVGQLKAAAAAHRLTQLELRRVRHADPHPRFAQVIPEWRAGDCIIGDVPEALRARVVLDVKILLEFRWVRPGVNACPDRIRQLLCGAGQHAVSTALDQAAKGRELARGRPPLDQRPFHRVESDDQLSRVVIVAVVHKVRPN